MLFGGGINIVDIGDADAERQAIEAALAAKYGMAAPVVAGAVALMLEANAALTPNAVKAMKPIWAKVNVSPNMK